MDPTHGRTNVRGGTRRDAGDGVTASLWVSGGMLVFMFYVSTYMYVHTYVHTYLSTDLNMLCSTYSEDWKLFSAHLQWLG